MQYLRVILIDFERVFLCAPPSSARNRVTLTLIVFLPFFDLTWNFVCRWLPVIVSCLSARFTGSDTYLELHNAQRGIEIHDYFVVLFLEIARDHFREQGIHEAIGGIVSPVHDSYKKKDLVAATHRCAMVKLSLKTSDWIRLSDWECNWQNQWTRTRLSLQHHQVSEPIYEHRDPALSVIYDRFVCKSFSKPCDWIYPRH